MRWWRRPLDGTREPGAGPAGVARFSFTGKLRPFLTDAVFIGERMRRLVMSAAKAELGEDRIPWRLSGHGLEASGRHDHAFFLPEDADGDGRIDHLTLHVPAGFDEGCWRVLGALGLKSRQLLGGRQGAWTVALDVVGHAASLRGVLPALPVAEAREWVSVTPYLHPWHAKPGFDAPAQLRREIAARGLPAPTILVPLPGIAVAGDVVPTSRFRLTREKPGLPRPDRRGSAWRVVFPEPIAGPLAFGFACHFGLGLFRAERQRARAGSRPLVSATS